MLVILLLLLLVPCIGLAIEFQPIEYKALSMGGAGVATSTGSLAPYYNPALLAEHHHGAQISVSGGVGIREVNLADHIDTLADIGITDTIDEAIDYVENNYAQALASGLPPELQKKFQTIISELKAIGTKNGLQLMPTASAGLQIGNFGLGIFGLAEGTAHAVIDPRYLDIIIPVDVSINGVTQTVYVKYDPDQNTLSPSTLNQYASSSLEYALDHELTYLKLSGMAYLEIPVAYAHKFPTPWGELDLGGAIKLMPGWTYDGIVAVDISSGDINSKLKDYDKTDTSWGIDLGLLFKPHFLKGLSLGLVGKNLNTPEFDTVTGQTYKIDPQARLGIAYDFSAFTLALDADLTKNKTFIPDYDTQYIGGGISFHPWSWFSLRAGAMQNIAESEEGLVLTGGLGMGLKWFQLDLAAQVSTKSGEFDGNDIPRYMRIQASIVSKWF